MRDLYKYFLSLAAIAAVLAAFFYWGMKTERSRIREDLDKLRERVRETIDWAYRNEHIIDSLSNILDSLRKDGYSLRETIVIRETDTLILDFSDTTTTTATQAQLDSLRSYSVLVPKLIERIKIEDKIIALQDETIDSLMNEIEDISISLERCRVECAKLKNRVRWFWGATILGGALLLVKIAIGS